MIIVEYRVPMPFTAAEYQIGQLYTMAKKIKLAAESSAASNGGSSKCDTKSSSTRGAGAGGGVVKILANEPYSMGPNGTSGQYIHRTHSLIGSHLPDWIKRLLPDSAAKLNEEAWNAYPYSKNKFTNPICSKLLLEIESRYLDGPPVVENVFNLSEKEAQDRSIVMIDFACDRYKAKQRHHEYNAATRIPSAGATKQNHCSKKSSKHSSTTTTHGGGADEDILNFEPLFRGALNKNWLQEYELTYAGYELQRSSSSSSEEEESQHEGSDDTMNIGDKSVVSLHDFNLNGVELKRSLMTCYKLIRISFPVWPLQSKVEHFIQQYCRDNILEAHKLTWLWQDEWTGMSLEEIRQLERETTQAAHLEASQMKQQSMSSSINEEVSV